MRSFEKGYEPTEGDFARLLAEAEAKWSIRDDEGAVVDLERALAGVWGRPDEVGQVSELATRLAEARPSEALSRFAERAAEGADALGAHSRGSALVEDARTATKPTDWRRRLGLLQIVVFTVVVTVMVAGQYLKAIR